LSFFKRIKKGVRFAVAGHKVSCDLPALEDSTLNKLQTLLSPLIKSTMGCIPHKARTDFFLIGVLTGVTLGFFRSGGLLNPELLVAYGEKLPAKALGIKQQHFTTLLDNMNSQEEQEYLRGVRNGQGYVVNVLSGDNLAMVPFIRYLDDNYGLIGD